MNPRCPHRHHAALPELANRLRRQARRLTAPREAILEILRGQAHPLSVKEIHSHLTNVGSDLVTVYRSVHLLEEMGMVKRFDLGDRVSRYELIAEGDDGHHHHLVCVRCAGVVELEECPMLELEKLVANRNGFKAVTHKLEFFGICPTCQE